MADETLLTIPDATRRVLECRHMKFDTRVVVSGDRPFTVMVFHAAYGIGAIRRPAVIKFTKNRHAIAHSENIKLATPSYFRRMEHPDGIADPMETRLVENYDAAEYFDKSGIKRPTGLAAGMGSVTLTKGANNFWMYCRSMPPGTPWQLDKMQRENFPQYDCVTTIPNPSKFATRLGIDVGRAEYDIQLNVLELVGHALLPPELGKKIITVHHGPVIYDDQPATVINRIPELQRGRALPFFKGTRSASQR